jgi:pyruvate kinase
MIDDGRLEFRVMERRGNSVKLKTVKGGEVKSRKGINIPEMDCQTIKALVRRDFECLGMNNCQDVDWVALSFVGRVEDIEYLKRELKRRKIEAKVVAKIERLGALQNLTEIIKEADGVMVARGDLGVEVPLYEVPYWQKEIIRQCREQAKPVITATEMLQSMIESPRPTRAEVSDVANAVYDGTDGVMLSAESAAGKYPVEAVKVMRQEASFSETKVEYPEVEITKEGLGQTAAVVTAANALIECGYRGVCDLAAVVVLTETGTTARYLSRLRPKLPILGVTSSRKTRDQMKLLWGVRPFYFPFKRQSEMSIRKILEFLKKEGQIKPGENVVMIYGELWGKPGLTSVVRIQAVV